MNKLNPYKSVDGYTVVYDHGKIKVITKEKFDVWDGTIILPKTLIQFILDQQLPSPLEFTVLSLSEEVGGYIDAICYSPDERLGFLTCKNLHYLSK